MNLAAVQIAGVTKGEDVSALRDHARCIKRCVPLVDLSVRFLLSLGATGRYTAAIASPICEVGAKVRNHSVIVQGDQLSGIGRKWLTPDPRSLNPVNRCNHPKS